MVLLLPLAASGLLLGVLRRVLGLLLVVVLVEREAAAAQRRHRRHALLDLVPLRVLRVLLRLVPLVLHGHKQLSI